MVDAIHVGDSAHVSKTIGEVDVTLFAAVSLDTNPVHLDAAYAAESRFGRRIAHGLIAGGLISACLGTRMPGPGTVYLSQELRFLKPVYLGDTLTASVEVLEVSDKGRVTLQTDCRNQDDEIVVDGLAVVLAPRQESR